MPSCLARSVQQRFTSLLRNKWPRCRSAYLAILCAAHPVFSTCSKPDDTGFNACRPAPVSIEERKAILDSLPLTGEVTQLSPADRLKLNALIPVLRLHQREDVYHIKVIDVPQAWIGLYARAVLLISRPALRLVSTGELAGLAAHEVGHEYMAQEYAAAAKSEDKARMQELELRCDAIATATLVRLGMKPNLLAKAVVRVAGYNRDRFGRAVDEDRYPPLKMRRKRIQKVATALQLSSGQGPSYDSKCN